jgi:asparagine synthase (glutamine-hydrolysing)
MYPYVAFLHNAQHRGGKDAAQRLIEPFRRTHREWAMVDEGRGVSLFHAPPPGRSIAVTILPAGSGAILGTLFPNNLDVSPRNWRPQIDEQLAEAIVQTSGRHLMNKFWGSYIAFISNHDGTVHHVLRDCSGKIPCWIIAFGDSTIVFSNIEDLSGLPIRHFSINKQYLAGFIYEAELSQRDCALNEVKELLAGECLELKDAHARQFSMWSPPSICREDLVENFDDACRQVARVTQACVDFWASKYDRIVHHLSGGLDSSVILGCLKRSAYRPLITCVHLDSGGKGENERAFAQIAADAAGVELVIQPAFSGTSRYDEQVLQLPRAPKPSVAHLGSPMDSDSRNFIPSRANAEAIWDGQGGDHLFFESHSPFGAVDYAFCRGIAGDFSRHVRDAVRLSRLSYWGVLRKSIRLGLLRSKWRPEDEYDREATFLNPEIVPTNLIDYVWQPWSENASDIPPGKRLQISLLSSLIHRHRPIPGVHYAYDHHPLFSQPLFELCLRIPIYTLLQGGINRALERAAFRDCVPEPIIRRHTKGSIETTFMSKLRESLPFIRDLILDGVLVQERILERSALEPFLAANRPMNPRVLWPFLSCIAAEVWARNWAATTWRV